jgi:hypothetical protein
MCAGSPRLGVLRRLRPVPAARPTAGPALNRALAAHDRADRNGSRVHCDSLVEVGAQLCPCGIATVTPQSFTVASRQTSISPPRSSPPRNEGNGYAPLPAHIRQVGAGKPLKDVNAGSSRTPLRHARRTHAIWQYWRTPALSGLLSPSPALPGSGCPQLRRLAATRSAAEGLSPPLESSAPHGARGSRLRRPQCGQRFAAAPAPGTPCRPRVTYRCPASGSPLPPS